MAWSSTVTPGGTVRYYFGCTIQLEQHADTKINSDLVGSFGKPIAKTLIIAATHPATARGFVWGSAALIQKPTVANALICGSNSKTNHEKNRRQRISQSNCLSRSLEGDARPSEHRYHPAPMCDLACEGTARSHLPSQQIMRAAESRSLRCTRVAKSRGSEEGRDLAERGAQARKKCSGLAEE